MRGALKNCPFCGGKAVAKYRRTKTVITPLGNEAKIPIGTGYWTIGCTTYDCILYYQEFSNTPRLMFVSGSKAEMISKWNRRADDEGRMQEL